MQTAPPKYLSDEDVDRIIDRSIKQKPADPGADSKGDTEPTAKKENKPSDTTGLRSTLADFDESADFVALRNFEGVNYKRDDKKP